jgi:hypothetical protein
MGGAGGEGGEGGRMVSCDGDGDGAPRIGPGCCGAPDPCDCDDNDANVFPDQNMYFSVPRPFAPVGEEFDYNCDGAEEKEYVNDTNGCNGVCLGDVAFQGDNGDYYCGAPGTLITCMLLNCTAQGGVNLACR